MRAQKPWTAAQRISQLLAAQERAWHTCALSAKTRWRAAPTWASPDEMDQRNGIEAARRRRQPHADDGSEARLAASAQRMALGTMLEQGLLQRRVDTTT